MASAEPVVARGHGVVNGTSLDRNEVRRRALSGTILLSGNGVALQAIGFGVTVVFARVLGPAGLGVVAFGMTLMTLVRYVGGGQAFAGTLIRAHEDPSPAELHSVLGLQLILVGTLTAVAAGTALAFGEVGRVTAVMLLALPIVAFRTPAVVLLERQLRYRAITLTDTADTLTYYAWGLATLALGWGVWGIATAMIARALAGTFVIVALAPRRVIAPRFSWSRSRHMLGFASRIQAQELTEALRDQGLNIGIAAVGGLHILGIWSLASRFLQLPFLLFNSVQRVSFPAMSRIISAGEDPRPIVERTLRLSMLGSSIIVTSLVAVAPALVPVAFGQEWSTAADVLAVAGVGVVVISAAALAFNGYLWAVGDASTPLRGTLASSIIWPMATFALMPVIGVVATGVGLVVGYIANAAVLARGASRHLGLRAGRQLFVGVAAAAVASGAGFVTAKTVGVGLASAAVAEIIALLTYAAMLLAVDRATALEMRTVVARVARSIRVLIPARSGASG
jgi:O-antigen/teichoic acid export membrane protein